MPKEKTDAEHHECNNGCSELEDFGHSEEFLLLKELLSGIIGHKCDGEDKRQHEPHGEWIDDGDGKSRRFFGCGNEQVRQFAGFRRPQCHRGTDEYEGEHNGGAAHYCDDGKHGNAHRPANMCKVQSKDEDGDARQRPRNVVKFHTARKNVEQRR